MTLDPTAVLRDLLRDEHAAVYAYGVLGARLGDRHRALARSAHDGHRASRDALRSRLIGMGEDPAGPPPAYDLAVAGSTQALQLAVRVEEHLAVRWRDLVGVTPDPSLRRFAVQGLQDAAVRAALWRRAAGLPLTQPFPGSA